MRAKKDKKNLETKESKATSGWLMGESLRTTLGRKGYPSAGKKRRGEAKGAESCPPVGKRPGGKKKRGNDETKFHKRGKVKKNGRSGNKKEHGDAACSGAGKGKRGEKKTTPGTPRSGREKN